MRTQGLGEEVSGSLLGVEQGVVTALLVPELEKLSSIAPMLGEMTDLGARLQKLTALSSVSPARRLLTTANIQEDAPVADAGRRFTTMAPTITDNHDSIRGSVASVSAQSIAAINVQPGQPPSIQGADRNHVNQQGWLPHAEAKRAPAAPIPTTARPSTIRVQTAEIVQRSAPPARPLHSLPNAHSSEAPLETTFGAPVAPIDPGASDWPDVFLPTASHRQVAEAGQEATAAFQASQIMPSVARSHPERGDSSARPVTVQYASFEASAESPTSNDVSETASASTSRQGMIILDGSVLGRWIIEHITRSATQPGAGTTGVDPRIGPIYPGAPIDV